MASGCVPGEVEEGRQDRDEEAVKVYLIRFIADLPLRLVYGLRVSLLEDLMVDNSIEAQVCLLCLWLICDRL